MAKSRSSFVCQACGAVTTQWQGRCDACGDWNTIVEEIHDSGVGAGPKSAKAGSRPTNLVPLSGETESAARVVTGIAELDRVTGGGFVMGSALLVGGDPGIGKSTLLLQVAAKLASSGNDVVYVSGEESAEQVRLRAVRLGLGQAPVRLASATSVRDILTTMGDGKPPALLIIDYDDRVSGSSLPGIVERQSGLVTARNWNTLRALAERSMARVKA